jgi:hypothetical protein
MIRRLGPWRLLLMAWVAFVSVNTLAAMGCYQWAQALGSVFAAVAGWSLLIGAIVGYVALEVDRKLNNRRGGDTR